jgi:putative N6-adenine-specific DNA methylase
MQNMKKSRIVITCARGISSILGEEIVSLGLPLVSEEGAGVVTEGTMHDAMRLNLGVRTGHHVLFLFGEFRAEDPEELYLGVSRMAWEDVVEREGYICVHSSVENRFIRDPRYANVKCKDAIVDRMNRVMGQRPDSGPERDRTVVFLYWKNERCSVYLDTSGETLSRRGYRRIPLRAPMQETLAAAVTLSARWKGKGNYVNPMCGSGTLAIEAALLGLKKAPGLLRENYGFMHLKGFRRTSWEDLRKEAINDARGGLEGRIIATDIRPEAVDAAKKNAAAAGVEGFIEFGVCDYRETPVPEGGGVVILNPEYGERMGRPGELEGVYTGIGDFFKTRCAGYAGYLFTGNPELAKKVGLRAKRRQQFFNGGIECRLLEYELYEGSRKEKNIRGEK